MLRIEIAKRRDGAGVLRWLMAEETQRVRALRSALSGRWFAVPAGELRFGLA